jgi:hypothetical protein
MHPRSKLLYYYLLDYVQRTYTRGTSKGWRSDMGKVFMFFGPPAQTSAAQPRNLRQSVGGTQQKLGEQIWIYQPMPDLGLTTRFKVTFREYQYGYELDFQTPQIVQRALEIFPSKVIFNPDIQGIPRYRFFLDQDSFEGELINTFTLSGEEVKDIPLEWKPIFAQAANEDTYVSFLVKVDPQQLDKNKLEEMTFFGIIEGEGTAEEDFLKSVETTESEAGGLLATFGLPAKPGQSILYLGARGKDNKPYTLLMSELEIPDFWNDNLDTSTIILSHEVTPASKQDAAEEFDPYRVGRFKATPRWGNVLKQNESMNVLFQIYNPQAENEEVSLKVEYFIISEKVSYRLNPQDITQKVEPGQTIAGGTEIPLSPLDPGTYALRIKITDNHAEKSIQKETEFVVE